MSEKMSRYVPRANWMDDERLHQPSCTVMETEIAAPRWSGLYDAAGNKLMVVETREPIGFVRKRGSK